MLIQIIQTGCGCFTETMSAEIMFFGGDKLGPGMSSVANVTLCPPPPQMHHRIVAHPPDWHAFWMFVLYLSIVILIQSSIFNVTLVYSFSCHRYTLNMLSAAYITNTTNTRQTWHTCKQNSAFIPILARWSCLHPLPGQRPIVCKVTSYLHYGKAR